MVLCSMLAYPLDMRLTLNPACNFCSNVHPGLKQNAVVVELIVLRLRNLCHYICDVIRNNMIPKDLPFSKCTGPKLAKKQHVCN